MRRCPITYEPIEDGLYSSTGFNKLNTALKKLDPLPFTDRELALESQRRMSKMSIQGVQPKLSARLSVKQSQFEIVDRHGIFILKPNPPLFEQVPENEDLSMRLASLCGIETPLHGMVYNKEMKLVYFIRRFDRIGKSGKVHVEDFAQIAGMTRDTKYNYSMEKVAGLIEKYCTFPTVEKLKLFRLTLFSYLTGNEDMHLKNFSIIHKDGMIALTPAYNLLNTTIMLANPKEELALSLKGKKSNFTKNILFSYFGNERLGLNRKVLSNIEEEFQSVYKIWIDVIDSSFLSNDLKEKYTHLIHERRKAMGW